MKTYFAMHCITRRNIDDKTFNKDLRELGYDDYDMPENERPSKIDIAQGQIDEPLIQKGRKQAEFLGKQINDFQLPINKIYCANQKRCKETAEIIANKMNEPCRIIVDDRINARSYGIIAEQEMDSDKLKHFWKYDVDFETLKTIAFYLLAPEKIGAEPKDDFKSRVRSFINDENYDFNNALIIAGSDTWKQIKKDNYFYAYKNENESDLKRGQIALIDFEQEKEKKTRQTKKHNKEM